jgi:hypothetical protein
MSVVFAAISTVLAFISAIIMAIPILGQEQIDLPIGPIVNNLSVYDANTNETKEAILGFNRKLWKSFRDQRRYTTYSLLLLAVSLVIQLSTQLFSLP